MTARIVGPWSPQRIDRFLAETVIPLRLGCLTGSGAPLVASHWFLWRDGALWCATPRTARVARYLAREPRCSFEIATNGMPYRGVRGQGRASIVPDQGEAVLRALVARYLGDDRSPFARWLLARTAAEVAIRIEPRRLRGWDFTRRMLGAGAAPPPCP